MRTEGHGIEVGREQHDAAKSRGLKGVDERIAQAVDRVDAEVAAASPELRRIDAEAAGLGLTRLEYLSTAADRWLDDMAADRAALALETVVDDVRTLRPAWSHKP